MGEPAKESLKPLVGELLKTLKVEIPETGLSKGRLTMWFCFDGKPSYALCVEGNSYDAASLNSIGGILDALSKAMLAASDPSS